MKANTSLTLEHLVILDKIPYEFNRVVPSNDKFLMLSFPKRSGNSSLLFVQAVTDQKYSSGYKVLWDREYLVVHWEKIDKIKTKQKRIVIAFPGAIRKITAKTLNENNVTMSLNMAALPQQMNIRTDKFCKSKLRHYRLGTLTTGYYDYTVECHSFEMALHYYYIEKVVPHLPRPKDKFKYDFLNHRYRNSRWSCVKGSRGMAYRESWIKAAKICKRKKMSFPEFFIRRDQEELLNLLKIANIFPIKALFIGLKASSGQVSKRDINFKILSYLCLKVIYLHLSCSLFTGGGWDGEGIGRMEPHPA